MLCLREFTYAGCAYFFACVLVTHSNKYSTYDFANQSAFSLASICVHRITIDLRIILLVWLQPFRSVHISHHTYLNKVSPRNPKYQLTSCSTADLMPFVTWNYSNVLMVFTSNLPNDVSIYFQCPLIFCSLVNSSFQVLN